jgi:hypothetical protein
MEAAGSSKMLIPLLKTKRRNSPEDSDLNNQIFAHHKDALTFIY